MFDISIQFQTAGEKRLYTGVDEYIIISVVLLLLGAIVIINNTSGSCTALCGELYAV